MSNNVHYLLIGLALLFVVVACIVKPFSPWPVAVAVLLIAIELFSRVSKVLVATLIIGGMALVARSETTNSITLQILNSETNWAAVPYFKYDINQHHFGYGGALLYKVSDNFWTGVRADRIDGVQTTAGVQAQLQVTTKIAGVTVTPFAETSVGLGSTSVYASAGPGAFIHVYSHQFNAARLNIELVGDYEHVVESSLNSNQLNVGPIFNLSF